MPTIYHAYSDELAVEFDSPEEARAFKEDFEREAKRVLPPASNLLACYPESSKTIYFNKAQGRGTRGTYMYYVIWYMDKFDSTVTKGIAVNFGDDRLAEWAISRLGLQHAYNALGSGTLYIETGGDEFLIWLDNPEERSEHRIRTTVRREEPRVSFALRCA